MAARKDPEDRVRRNKPGTSSRPATTGSTMALPEWDGVYRGFDLKARNTKNDWTNDTLIWWDRWRKSPQAMYTTALDWESLYVAAIIHNKIMLGCSHTALAALTGELRKREGMFGASMEDRQRLNMGNGGEADETGAEAAVTNQSREVVDYFTKLTKRAAEAKEK